MRQRGIASAGTALLTSTVLLASCGHSKAASAASTKSPVTITVSLESGGSAQKTKLAFINALNAGFEKKYPNVHVKVEYQPANTSPSTAIDTMVASHSGPNVYEFGTTFMPTIASSGAFVKWTKSMLSQPSIKELVPATTRMDAMPGQPPVGIIDSAGGTVLWYNKAMFSAAHIPSPPRTWAGFLKDAKKLTHPTQGVWGAVIAPADPFYSGHVLWVLNKQEGGSLLNSKGTKPLFTSRTVTAAARFYSDWMRSYRIVSTADVQYTESDAAAAFVAGKAAMLPVGSVYDLPAMKAANPKFVTTDLGMAPNPIVPYGRSGVPSGSPKVEAFVGGQELAIFKYSSSAAQVEAASHWIAYYVSKNEQAAMWRALGFWPVNQKTYASGLVHSPFAKTYEYVQSHEYPTRRAAGWLALETVVGKVFPTLFDKIALHQYRPGDVASTLRTIDTQLSTSLASASG